MNKNAVLKELIALIYESSDMSHEKPIDNIYLDVIDAFADYEEDDPRWLEIADRLENIDPDAANIIRLHTNLVILKNKVASEGDINKATKLKQELKNVRNEYNSIKRLYEKKFTTYTGQSFLNAKNVIYNLDIHGLPSFITINFDVHNICKEIKELYDSAHGKFIHGVALTKSPYTEFIPGELDTFFSMQDLLKNTLVLFIEDMSQEDTKIIVKKLTENIRKFRNLRSIQFNGVTGNYDPVEKLSEDDITQLIKKLPPSVKFISIRTRGFKPNFIRNLIELKIEDVIALEKIELNVLDWDEYDIETLKSIGHSAGLELAEYGSVEKFY